MLVYNKHLLFNMHSMNMKVTIPTTQTDVGEAKNASITLNV